MIQQNSYMEKELPASSSRTTNQNPEEPLSTRVMEYIEEKPAKSILVGLGVGIGAGLLVGSILRSSGIPLSRDTDLMEKIGKNVKDSVSELLPASLLDKFKS